MKEIPNMEAKDDKYVSVFLFKLNKLLLTSLLTQSCHKPLFLGQRRNLRKQYVFYPVND